MKLPNTKQKKEVKKLARKYFINLKIKEILIVFICIPFVIFVPYFVGLLWGEDNCIGILEPSETCSILSYWVMGFFTLAFGGFLIAIIGICVYLGIKNWIKSNWERAYEKAEEKVGVDSHGFGYCEDYKEFYK